MPDSEYEKNPHWNAYKDGTDTNSLQKIYYLLHKVESPFDISSKLNFIEYCIEHDCLKFNHPVKGDLFLFFPDDKFTAYYKKSKGDDEVPIDETGFDECFDEISRIVSSTSEKDLRFIIPIFETGFTGCSHVVTMIIDYDFRRQTLRPVIYDSIGRGTLADLFATFIYKKQESTADNTLNQYLREKLSGILEIYRLAYNHQNRRTNSQCGLFAFRVIHHAINEFSEKGIGLLKIPSSQNRGDTDSSFLTGTHITSIQKCIHKDNFTFSELLEGFGKVKFKTRPGTTSFFFKSEDFPPLKPTIPKENNMTTNLP